MPTLADVPDQSLGDGVHLTAPGLLGEVDLSTPVRAQTPGSKLLHQALGNAGITATRAVLITHTTPASGARSSWSWSRRAR